MAVVYPAWDHRANAEKKGKVIQERKKAHGGGTRLKRKGTVILSIEQIVEDL